MSALAAGGGVVTLSSIAAPVALALAGMAATAALGDLVTMIAGPQKYGQEYTSPITGEKRWNIDPNLNGGQQYTTFAPTDPRSPLYKAHGGGGKWTPSPFPGGITGQRGSSLRGGPGGESSIPSPQPSGYLTGYIGGGMPYAPARGGPGGETQTDARIIADAIMKSLKDLGIVVNVSVRDVAKGTTVRTRWGGGQAL